MVTNQTVRDVMTGDPESVDRDSTVQEAARVMAKLNVGSVPVVAGGRVTGIVTDRDITLRVIAAGQHPSRVRVEEIASPDPICVTSSTSMSEAADLMARNQIRRLPVVDDGRLVGMLSLGDLSVGGAGTASSDALKEISEPAEPRD